MPHKLLFQIIIVLFVSCKSGKENGKLIRNDFAKHKMKFEAIQKEACDLSIQENIRSIRKDVGGTNKDRSYYISRGFNEEVLNKLSLDSVSSLQNGKIIGIIDFLDSHKIDYMSCDGSVFVLGYFQLSVRSDIYLYRTNNIDSIYNGSPGVLEMAELLISDDEDEWAEQLGKDWYLIAIKKNL